MYTQSGDLPAPGEASALSDYPHGPTILPSDVRGGPQDAGLGLPRMSQRDQNQINQRGLYIYMLSWGLLGGRSVKG